MASFRRLVIPTTLAMTLVGTSFVACESGGDDEPPGPIGGSSDPFDAGGNGDSGIGDGGAGGDGGNFDAAPEPDAPVPPDAPFPEPDGPVG